MRELRAGPGGGHAGEFNKIFCSSVRKNKASGSDWLSVKDILGAKAVALVQYEGVAPSRPASGCKARFKAEADYQAIYLEVWAFRPSAWASRWWWVVTKSKSRAAKVSGELLVTWNLESTRSNQESPGLHLESSRWWWVVTRPKSQGAAKVGGELLATWNHRPPLVTGCETYL